MGPRLFSGPRGGKYVQSEKGDKIYVPANALRWYIENSRWRLYLKDGTNMLFPPLIS
jgi:hypothetical protein